MRGHVIFAIFWEKKTQLKDTCHSLVINDIFCYIVYVCSINVILSTQFVMGQKSSFHKLAAFFAQLRTVLLFTQILHMWTYQKNPTVFVIYAKNAASMNI